MHPKLKHMLESWNAAKRGRRPVPYEIHDKALVPGIEGLRAFIDGPAESFIYDAIESIKTESDDDFPGDANGLKTYPFLSISGGSSHGAFGAGLLKGWSKHGSRPKFKAVTGVSTGALMAPPAFLGSEYDEIVEKFYTTSTSKDIFIPQPVVGLLGSSVASTGPLQKIIRENYNKEILAGIAREHKRGRRLYIGTTNLDAQRMVLWNIGKLALMKDVDSALGLFHKVILASASIPILFPPVFFDVEAEGEMYDELHVDGSAVSQVFSLYGVLDGLAEAAIKEGLAKPVEQPSYGKQIMDFFSGKSERERAKETRGGVDLYIIRNGYLEPRWKPVRNNIPAIAERSIDTMINSQAMGDILRLYFFAEARGNHFNLAYIPGDHHVESKEMFDPGEMRRLFDRAYDMAAKGYPWDKKPPMVKHLGQFGAELELVRHKRYVLGKK